MSKNELKDHKNKCRCCFQTLRKRQQHVNITESIATKFFSISQVKLKISQNYSNQICSNCDKELEEYAKFRKTIGDRQLRLYKNYPDIKPKVETESFPCDILIKTEPETEVKIENVNIDEMRFEENVDFLRDTLMNEEAEDKKKRLPKKNRPKQLCNDCGKHVVNYKRHWRRTHSKIINYICDLCGYGNLLRFQFIKHMKRRHLPRELRDVHQCPHCEFTSVNKDYIRAHIKDHIAPEVHDCECGKQFSNKYKLAQHQKVSHLKDLKHKCSYCAKAFQDKKYLSEHVLIHHLKKDVRDKICEICSKKFITEQQLKNHHILMHSEGSFQCEFCSKKFHRISKLNRHQVTHTKEKSFVCDKCPASYPYSSHLYRHQQIVHLGLKIHCEVPGCSTTFVRRDNYRNHLKKHHRNLEESYIEQLMRQATFVD
jgi:hypothetical protein